jgi:hypothetical protein
MLNTVPKDPLIRSILVFLGVFIVGMLATNEQARLLLLHPFSL